MGRSCYQVANLDVASLTFPSCCFSIRVLGGGTVCPKFRSGFLVGHADLALMPCCHLLNDIPCLAIRLANVDELALLGTAVSHVPDLSYPICA
ncbi:hypothetical protein Nepgr_007904 [Nepenthes gracilis]|uniref:Uncharacterized protein n=1 Tax=Nepenthes gracilis TaxID=150966 RepID=A0AAD3S7Z5_NEPGR|nr:hypothetical protein Nepgr_007904 [Nepenthes gracilis]